MKISHIFIILFLASLVLLLPTTRQEETYNLEPRRPLTVVINVQAPDLILEGSQNSEIDYELYYLDSENNVETLIRAERFGDTVDARIQVENRGFYKLVMRSDKLAIVTVRTEGIPDTSIVIVSLTMLLAVGGQIQKQFSRSFDY